MKNLKLLWALCLATLGLVSCEMEPNQNFQQEDLYGTWQEVGTEAFVRFMSPEEDSAYVEIQADSTQVTYLYGCEWDLADDVNESDLVYHGNGWFRWKLVQSDLTEIHLMDNGGAEIPKIYTVTTLTQNELVYQDTYKKAHSFTRVP